MRYTQMRDAMLMDGQDSYHLPRRLRQRGGSTVT